MDVTGSDSRVIDRRDVHPESPWRRGVPGRLSPPRLAAAVLSMCTAALLLAPAAGATTAVPSQGEFSDLGDAPAEFSAALKALESADVLSGTGCGDGKLCPNGSIPRWEAAVWLTRVLDGTDPPDGLTTRFADVDATAWWAPHTERLAQLEITNGCATDPARFCPQDSVSREQMAALVASAFDPEPASPAGFEDTSGSFAASDIDALHAAGVVAGCSTDPLLFCPERSTTRAEMARAIHNALTLLGDSDSDAADTGTASTGATDAATGGGIASSPAARSSEGGPDAVKQSPAEAVDQQQPATPTEDPSTAGHVHSADDPEIIEFLDRLLEHWRSLFGN